MFLAAVLQLTVGAPDSGAADSKTESFVSKYFFELVVSNALLNALFEMH